MKYMQNLAVILGIFFLLYFLGVKISGGYGPVVCRVKADIEQKILPRQANYMKEDGQMASRPLDDMAPLLSRDEIEAVRWNEEYRMEQELWISY